MTSVTTVGEIADDDHNGADRSSLAHNWTVPSVPLTPAMYQRDQKRHRGSAAMSVPCRGDPAESAAFRSCSDPSCVPGPGFACPDSTPATKHFPHSSRFRPVNAASSLAAPTSHNRTTPSVSAVAINWRSASAANSLIQASLSIRNTRLCLGRDQLLSVPNAHHIVVSTGNQHACDGLNVIRWSESSAALIWRTGTAFSGSPTSQRE